MNQEKHPLAPEFAALVAGEIERMTGKTVKPHVNVGEQSQGDSFLRTGRHVLSINTTALSGEPVALDLAVLFNNLKEKIPGLELDRHSLRVVVDPTQTEFGAGPITETQPH